MIFSFQLEDRTEPWASCIVILVPHFQMHFWNLNGMYPKALLNSGPSSSSRCLYRDKPPWGTSPLVGKSPLSFFPFLTPQTSQTCICDIAFYASGGRLFCQELAVRQRKEPYFERHYRPSVLLKEMEGVVLGHPPVWTGFGVPLESPCSETSVPSFSLHHLFVLQFYSISTSLFNPGRGQAMWKGLRRYSNLVVKTQKE